MVYKDREEFSMEPHEISYVLRLANKYLLICENCLDENIELTLTNSQHRQIIRMCEALIKIIKKNKELVKAAG